MTYKILEVHLKYKDGQLEEVAVLWESNDMGSVRATHITSQECSGYQHLTPGEQVSDGLLQDVAGYGMNLDDAKKKKFFPGKRQWDN